MVIGVKPGVSHIGLRGFLQDLEPVFSVKELIKLKNASGI